MQEYEPALAACALFAGQAPAETEALLRGLDARRQAVAEGAVLYAAGTDAYRMGILLAGSLDIIQEDYWGNEALLARLAPGDLFAESFALAKTPHLPVTLRAGTDAVVLLLDHRLLLQDGGAGRARAVENLLTIIARKNIALTQKMELVTRRTMREKVLAFLSAQAKEAGQQRFAIPFDRQAMADYLAVDRSALSRLLGEMRREGVLDFSGNVFALK